MERPAELSPGRRARASHRTAPLRTDVAAVQGRPSSFGRSGVTQLVVHNQMDTPADSEMWQIRECKCFRNNPLTAERSVAVNLDQGAEKAEKNRRGGDR